MLFQIIVVFSDIAHFYDKIESAQISFDLMENNKDKIKGVVDEFPFLFALANIKSNKLKTFKAEEQDFNGIKDLNSVKDLYYSAMKCAPSNDEKVTCYINIGNILNQHWRITESIYYYELASKIDPNYVQIKLNRAYSLELLIKISNKYNKNIIIQIRNSLQSALDSGSVNSFDSKYNFYNNKLDRFNEIYSNITDDENISYCIDSFLNRNTVYDYASFCKVNSLALSEHSLYCPCDFSPFIDDLTLVINGVSNSTKMEMVLNRLKSEYSLARSFFFEYVDKVSDSKLEVYFDGYFNNEILSQDIEKLKVSFRICFGILDKIAVAICEHFDFYHKNKNVYFHNFWSLDLGDRLEKLNKEQNYALLALYSIATDLNSGGEWDFYKLWRNNLEHNFVIIYDGDFSKHKFDSEFEKKVNYISKSEFINNLNRLLILTRSAIFSFSYAVKQKTLKDNGLEIINVI